MRKQRKKKRGAENMTAGQPARCCRRERVTWRSAEKGLSTGIPFPKVLRKHNEGPFTMMTFLSVCVVITLDVDDRLGQVACVSNVYFAAQMLTFRKGALHLLATVLLLWNHLHCLTCAKWIQTLEVRHHRRRRSLQSCMVEGPLYRGPWS